MADGDGVMLQATFNTEENNRGKEVTVTFDAGHIYWDVEAGTDSKTGPAKTEGKHKGSLAIDDVLLATLDATEEENGVSFTIHHVTRIYVKKERRLGSNSVRFFGSQENCNEWVDAIQGSLATKFPHRPKRLLAFINPISGRRNGPKIFDQQVRPLLDKFVTETEVVVTEKANHIEEVLLNKSLEGVDGILSVGGDGTFTEVVNGLARRSAKDLGVDVDNHELSLSPTPFRVGVIPTGSGDILIQYANDCRDVVTATLCVILGESIDKDVASVHSGGKLARFTNLCAGVGFFVDGTRKSEANRWMGMGRLLWGGLYTFAKHSGVEIEVDYLPYESSQNGSDAPGPKESPEPSPPPDLATGWRRVSGHFIECSGYMLDPFRQSGDARQTYGDGKLSLIMVKHCSRKKHWSYVWKFFTRDSTARDFDYLELLATKAFKLRPVGSWQNDENNLYLVVDGDVVRLPEPEFVVRLHTRLIRMFVRKDDEDEAREEGAVAAAPSS